MKRKFRNRIRDGIIGLYPVLKDRDTPCRILAFHEVYSVDMFTHKMDWLRDNFPLVDLSDLVEGKTKGVAITFDDGHKSWFSTVLPYFVKYNIPCTFFINSGLIEAGLSNTQQEWVDTRLNRKGERLLPLSIKELEEMSFVDLFEFGSHTVDHIDLSILGISKRPYILNQIEDDIRQIEIWTNRKIKYLAYPFGESRHAPNYMADILKMTEIENAFTTVPGDVQFSTSFFVGRDALEFWQSDRVWEHWLYGAYDKLFKLKERMYGIPNDS